MSSLLLAAYSFLITSCAREVALLLGSSERLLPLAVEYMHWFAPFLPFSALLSSGMFFIRLDGRPTTRALQRRSGGHQHRTGLRFHLHPRLGHDGRGAGHEPRLYRGCGMILGYLDAAATSCACAV